MILSIYSLIYKELSLCMLVTSMPSYIMMMTIYVLRIHA